MPSSSRTRPCASRSAPTPSWSSRPARRWATPSSSRRCAPRSGSPGDQDGVTALPADPEIAGDGVRLRRWRPDDVAPVTDAWQDPELRRRFAVADVTLASIDAFVRDATRAWDDGAAAMLAIVDAATDRVVGGCDLSTLGGDGPADVGYWVIAPRRGEGIARRAVAALLEWAGRELHRTEFVLELEADNAASVGVARALGFTPD